MIKDNVKRILETIEKESDKAGFGPVALVAVSKNRSIEEIAEAYDSGISLFGENRVQELVSKHESFEGKATWHMIGTLQSNKINAVLGKAGMVQSVDSVRLAQAISKRASALGSPQECLLQINTAMEGQKHGFEPESIWQAMEDISLLDGLRVKGLMMIAPDTNDGGYLGSLFARTRSLFEKAREQSSEYANMDMQILSMGMTNDFESAIRNGSTMVRIGRAIFEA
ncbi:MAG: YggS family pyridoxal phosphate-dependent enzyme [Eubacteriaceae bacterium]|nr:YggS family pyridoxal phosphate-dependent enzyme [Eubacteriaceae bacterium]